MLTSSATVIGMPRLIKHFLLIMPISLFSTIQIYQGYPAHQQARNSANYQFAESYHHPAYINYWHPYLIKWFGMKTIINIALFINNTSRV